MPIPAIIAAAAATAATAATAVAAAATAATAAIAAIAATTKHHSARDVRVLCFAKRQRVLGGMAQTCILHRLTLVLARAAAVRA